MCWVFVSSYITTCIKCYRPCENWPCEHKFHWVIFSLIYSAVSQFHKLQKKAHKFCSSDEDFVVVVLGYKVMIKQKQNIDIFVLGWLIVAGPVTNTFKWMAVHLRHVLGAQKINHKYIVVSFNSNCSFPTYTRPETGKLMWLQIILAFITSTIKWYHYILTTSCAATSLSDNVVWPTRVNLCVGATVGQWGIYGELVKLETVESSSFSYTAKHTILHACVHVLEKTCHLI